MFAVNVLSHMLSSWHNVPWHFLSVYAQWSCKHAKLRNDVDIFPNTCALFYKDIAELNRSVIHQGEKREGRMIKSDFNSSENSDTLKTIHVLHTNILVLQTV